MKQTLMQAMYLKQLGSLFSNPCFGTFILHVFCVKSKKNEGVMKISVTCSTEKKNTPIWRKIFISEKIKTSNRTVQTQIYVFNSSKS